MEIREEKSYLISTANQAGKSVLSYQIRDPLIAEPGERFEIALNQVAFPNTFATIREDRQVLQMRLRYEGYIVTIPDPIDGVPWSVFVNLTFPLGKTLSAEEICEFINRSLKVLIQDPITARQKPEEFDNELTICEKLFRADQVIVYTDPSYPANFAIYEILGGGMTPDGNPIAPKYADFFNIPFFYVENGRIRIDLPPQFIPEIAEPRPAESDGTPLNPTGYFCWNYPLEDYPDWRNGGTLESVIKPPACTLNTLSIGMDTDAFGFLTNLAPYLGFVANNDRVINPWVFAEDEFMRVNGLHSHSNYETFEFYGVDFQQNPNTTIYENRFWDDYMTTTGYMNGTTAKYYMMNEFGKYAVIDVTAPGGTNIYPYLLQIALPQSLESGQEMIGDADKLSLLLGSIPLTGTSVDERQAFYFHNRIFYGMRGGALRDLHLQFFVDQTPYLIPKNGMPIYVEVHVRRIYDPSSDRSRANAPLHADPYLGFRGFQGTDPSKLLLPSGTITHR